MGSRLLLINPNRCVVPDPVFPLGLAYLNAALRQAGHDTRVLDFLVGSETLTEALVRFKPDYVGISLRNIDNVLIHKQETFFESLHTICETVRRVHPCPIVLGGSGFSIYPQALLERCGADFGIQGEGESSLPALISALSEGRDYTAIPGVVYRREGRAVLRPSQFATIETQSKPGDRPPELVAHYLKTSGMLNLQTQRGCRYSCCYCTYPLIEGRQYRRRPPEVIAEEMAQLEALGAQYVFITDSVFNSSEQHVRETCDAIFRRRLSLRWGCFLRPQGLTAELMQLMARAGLAHIEFGSDSLFDPVLVEYGKRLTFDDIQTSSELARTEKIDFCHFLICGGPGETMTTLEGTFRNSLRMTGGVIIAVVGMRIYPGTPLADRARREGSLATNSDLLAPAYYLAPGLTEQEVFDQLREFARRSPKWIVGDPPPNFAGLVTRLRKRGVLGPLWGYFSMLLKWTPTSRPRLDVAT